MVTATRRKSASNRAPFPILDRHPRACHARAMREKELRLALVCYGGVSLAVYMHGITKEIWRLACASRAFHAGDSEPTGSEAVYLRLLRLMAEQCDLELRVLVDILAGASAGGINAVFLAEAISSGRSLDPLTDLWLETADVDRLMDEGVSAFSRMARAWQARSYLSRMGKGGSIRRTFATRRRNRRDSAGFTG